MISSYARLIPLTTEKNSISNMANFNKGHEGLKNAFVLTPTSLEDPVLFNSKEGLEIIESYGGVPKEELLSHVLRVVSL